MRRLAALAMILNLTAIAVGQDCVDGASDMRLRIEMAERGYTRWGCWTELEIELEWDQGDGELPLWYTMEMEGRGYRRSMKIASSLVWGERETTWWPAWVETLTARVAGVNDVGQGPWSEPDTLIVGR